MPRRFESYYRIRRRLDAPSAGRVLREYALNALTILAVAAIIVAFAGVFLLSYR